MLNVVCVDIGNYLGRGHEYVQKLAAGVRKNLHVPYRFICVTDGEWGDVVEEPKLVSMGSYGEMPVARFVPDVQFVRGQNERRPFVTHLAAEKPPEWTRGWNAGWAQKVMLYRPGFLPDGPVLYADLDTLPMGDLTPLTRIPVEFAGLRNFYDRGFGTGLLYWTEAGGARMWEFFERHADEIVARGGTSEQWAINQFMPGDPPRLQDFVDGIYSYKVHCKQGPPPDARVICFHGLPRPHEVNGWVREAWVV